MVAGGWEDGPFYPCVFDAPSSYPTCCPSPTHACPTPQPPAQVGESEPFISELLTGLTATIQDLETHQIHMFYEAVGLMISADTGAGAGWVGSGGSAGRESPMLPPRVHRCCCLLALRHGLTRCRCCCCCLTVLQTPSGETSTCSG